MLRRTRLSTAIATACTSLVIVGFVGPAGAGTNELEITRKEFVQSANETCATAYEDIDEVFEEELAGLEGGETPSESQVRAAVGRVVEILDQAATEIEALVGPPAFEARVQRFVSQFNAVVAKFEDDPKGMFEEELTGYPFAKPDKTARKLGLARCVQRQG